MVVPLVIQEELGLAVLFGVMRGCGLWDSLVLLGYPQTFMQNLGLLHGLQVAWDFGAQRVLCYSDSLDVVTLVTKGVPPSHCYATIVKATVSWFDEDWTVSVEHSLREGNACADMLAKCEVQLWCLKMKERKAMKHGITNRMNWLVVENLAACVKNFSHGLKSSRPVRGEGKFNRELRFCSVIYK